jgi:hypothetical protein
MWEMGVNRYGWSTIIIDGMVEGECRGKTSREHPT